MGTGLIDELTKVCGPIVKIVCIQAVGKGIFSSGSLCFIFHGVNGIEYSNSTLLTLLFDEEL